MPRSAMIPKDLLDILACPLDKAEVRLRSEGGTDTLVCTKCGRAYPVRDDIPVMLVEEAVLPAAGSAGA